MALSKPVGPYSPIVRAGDWLIVSGQLGLKDGVMVDGGVAAQARQALVNGAGLLKAAGAGLDKVAKAMVFLTDMNDFDAMNTEYVAAFGDHRPARSTYAVAGLPRGASVEIEMWAYTGPGGVTIP